MSDPIITSVYDPEGNLIGYVHKYSDQRREAVSLYGTVIERGNMTHSHAYAEVLRYNGFEVPKLRASFSKETKVRLARDLFRSAAEAFEKVPSAENYQEMQRRAYDYQEVVSES